MLSEALLDRDKPRTDRSEGEGWRDENRKNQKENEGEEEV